MLVLPRGSVGRSIEHVSGGFNISTFENGGGIDGASHVTMVSVRPINGPRSIVVDEVDHRRDLPVHLGLTIYSDHNRPNDVQGSGVVPLYYPLSHNLSSDVVTFVQGDNKKCRVRQAGLFANFPCGWGVPGLDAATAACKPELTVQKGKHGRVVKMKATTQDGRVEVEVIENTRRGRVSIQVRKLT